MIGRNLTSAGQKSVDNRAVVMTPDRSEKPGDGNMHKVPPGSWPEKDYCLLDRADLEARIRKATPNRTLLNRCVRILKDNETSDSSSLNGEGLAECLLILFEHDEVRHQTLADVAIRYLQDKYASQINDEDQFESVAARLGNDGLFLRMLEKTINLDQAFEFFLTNLRRFLLLGNRSAERSATRLRLLSAMAHQCFNNEYIFYEEPDEEVAVADVEEQLNTGLSISSVHQIEVPLLLFGMYRPLAGLGSAEVIEQLPLDSFSKEGRCVVIRMVHEPLEERRIARDIECLREVSTAVSKSVQKQYEENPYPRWFNLVGPFLSLETEVKRVDASFALRDSFGDQRLQILVPGCGTGLQPLHLAAANPDADILAMDLSRTSLAYAKRLAAKFQLSNLTFLQGDILHLAELGKRFHHIDCIGVLHHMKDPLSGVRALDQVLLPGGTLHLGVYSKIARMPINFLRQEIEKLRVRPVRKEIKGFRHQLQITERYKHMIRSLQRYDFYSLSSFRDLLFHVREHTFTLSEIRRMLELFTFKFLGFQVGPLKDKYQSLFPADRGLNSFANWMRFEKHYAGTCLLFRFWLQKLPD